MSAIPYETQTEGWDATEPEELATAPNRPRRHWLNRKSAALAAVLTLAAGFYAGVRVEKTQVSGATTTTTASAASAAARGGFGGAAGASSGASFGTVSSVNGNTLYLTESSGNTVKVTLSSATKITKSESVSKTSVHPGDTVVIQGAKGSTGTITATSVSDSGAGAARGAGGAFGGGAAGGSSTTSTTSGTGG